MAMGLAIHPAEMPHLIPVMQASESSLTFVVEDLNARRHATVNAGNSGADLETWLNALQRQTKPIIASSQGRANLEAWLALVEEQA
jgi:hypothetical protein